MSSMQVVKDDEGQSFIPSSQRPDGTWRKPIRVRSGYVPQEEQPVYVSKGRGAGGGSPSYPVGLSANDIGGDGGLSFPVGYFDSVELFRQSAGIPGLNFVQGADPLVPAKTKSKSKKKGTTTTTPAVTKDTPSATTSTTPKSSSSKTTTSTTSTSNASQGVGAIDPSKRLRNLKKRLKEIEDLEKRIASGELTAPEKEQLEKLKRKDEVEDEIEDLERQIDNLSFS